MNYSDLAEKYIGDHNNPLKKVELFGSKLFLSSLDEEEQKLKEKCLTGIENSLRYSRVERRCARSVAQWLPEKSLAKVTKITAACSGFGFQNKEGKFLNSEEALFLLEINKLELIYKNLPMSVEQAFKIVPNLEKYLVYKKLTLQGYKLKSAKNKTENEDNYEPCSKKAKLDEPNDVDKIFERLRQSAPRAFLESASSTESVDYCVNLPINSEKKTEAFNLIVESKEEYASHSGGNNVYAVQVDDDIAFYKFYNTNIPIL